MAMRDLVEILTWQRGANTKSEEAFVQLHIATIPDIQRDDFGNYHLQIGDEDPIILWSCHTDTVTRNEGRQNVKWIGKGILGLNNGKPGQCLGADDGAGVWLMLEMIKAKKPGYYVFHREEEIGGNGSTFLKDNPMLFPPSIQIAIAMDRAGTQDVITHQAFSRCCSDAFADTLANQLGGGFRRDDTGVFTDTANYIGLFNECTNLSVGYEHNHGPRETLDTNHLRRLLDKLLKLDENQLAIQREPGEEDPNDMYSNMYTSYPAFVVKREATDYSTMVRENPGIAARLLEELGVEGAEFRAHCFAFTGKVYEG